MIQIQELIKHFVLGIASLILIGTAMADDTKIRNFLNDIREVKEEYGKDSFEYSIPNKLLAASAVGAPLNCILPVSAKATVASNSLGILNSNHL